MFFVAGVPSGRNLGCHSKYLRGHLLALSSSSAYTSYARRSLSAKEEGVESRQA